jgi:holo-[acyl-carrier protein] synthase
VYTPREIRYCQERKRSIEHFAGRWAAKEAVLKCLGASGRKGMHWTDMEIRTDAGGTPRLHLCGSARDRAKELRIADILLSIAQCRTYATAYALALAEEAVNEAF